ncbi:hypothetical protein AVEN_130827-1 [Araneus ventricosus]|uniref:Uncharacterized protein n=1 Tax=Araneus ventricosus TaxID=182803 RepID=A0A4Y2JUH8_ARAVE|nr:hypothetical protein AVEN_130827-1 [Araneus ventricosus]
MGLWHSTKKSPDYYVLPPCECVWGGGDNYFITFETPAEAAAAAVCNPPPVAMGRSVMTGLSLLFIYVCRLLDCGLGEGHQVDGSSMVFASGN